MTTPTRQRVLVTGASGYVGGRLIPYLLEQGHQVRAAFLPDEDAERFPWSDQVEIVRMDALDPDSVAAAIDGVGAVYYLIHGMGGDDFVAKDRQSAQIMAQAARAAGVERLIYLSGIVPDVDDPDELSDHITSRREVEQILTDSGIHTVALRAAILLGSASTSYEIVRQVSERLPVQAIPTWMDSRVQPIAVDDALGALVGALSVEGNSRSYDIGGPEVLTYAQLLDRFAAVAGIDRKQLKVPLVPTAVVGKLTGLITDVPAPTVEALVESLHHDMVVHEDDFLTDLLPEGHALTTLDDALRRARGDAGGTGDPEQTDDPLAPRPTDPDWAGSRDR
ncbi:NAD(P)H-binding protein [Flexivirga sp. ID2601S]|uniref:NAD(P)H-binding protein n=1 Tax=Flexivirga aerilata TaxID=1656889 RepID=A0A849ACK3_9MICO|nr:NAD(P)H-binding protein [Flexivirga aerilata]